MLKTTLLVLLQAAAPADTIRWQPWSVTVEGRTIAGQLGRLRVPRDPAAPAGPTLDLAFVRLPATTRAPGSPIVYLAGGPGDSGIGSIRVRSVQMLANALRSSGDVILLDQRGTGLSEPLLRCPPGLPPRELYRDETTFRTALRVGMRQCADHWRAQGVNPLQFTTANSAADVDALRRALGVEQIRLVGFSYGTHLGLAVLRQFGSHIERVLLAGTEGPDDTEKLPLVLDPNLHRLAAAVRADPAISQLAPDLVAAYDSALARLTRAPARLRIPNPSAANDTVEIEVGAFGFQHIVTRDLGDTNDWPILPGLIVRTAQGDYGLLTAFARRRWGPVPSLMWAAMECASASSAERLAEAARQASISRFGSAMNIADTEMCRSVGVPALGDAYRSPLISAVPTLFVSGSLDTQTPPHQAERVRWGFLNSAHIVVENAGHESTLDVPAVLSSIARFMRGEAVASQSVRLPMPKFRGPATR